MSFEAVVGSNIFKYYFLLFRNNIKNKYPSMLIILNECIQ